MTETPPPEQQGRAVTLLNAAKGLTLTNVLILALLALVAVPVYIVYKALGDEKLLDRLMSSYEVIDSQAGCLVRHVQERGGPDLWGVSSGFAFQGSERWFVNVMLDREPTEDEIASHCAALKLIADRMLERGKVQSRPVPGAGANGSGHNGDLSSPEEEKAE